MLKLLNRGIAELYGVPLEDCEYDDAVKQILADHPLWVAFEAKAHLNAAIAAGAYAYSPKKPRSAEAQPHKE
jgi:hypothetical protein